MLVSRLKKVSELSSCKNTYDAISVTYSPDGFTPMNGWLLGFGIDYHQFNHPAIKRAHTDRRFRVIAHCDEKPVVITASKTERWDSELGAGMEIIRTADCERTQSLCMLQFGYVLGKFPVLAFEQCVKAVRQAKYWANISEVDVYVGDEHHEQAKRIWMQVMNEMTVL